MGCTPSKQSVCQNCNAQFSPVRRSYSSQPHHSPPQAAADHHRHVVALTSTTLGFLQLDSSIPNQEDFTKMITEKITKIAPQTPTRSPPGEPETINIWELMEGLDDSSPINLKPLWRKSSEKVDGVKENENLSCGKDKLVLYFTSLRGVRKTYEDCCHVRVILKSSGFRVDERDVSMHSGFKEELKELLGDRFGGGGGLLPKVFVGTKYIGGAEEIRRLHDEFQLGKVFDGCEMVDDDGGGGGGGGCEGCGDVRFLPCEMCSGSCKIYYEVDSDEGDQKEEDESDYGFQRCPDCNENGLVRCPICWD